MYQVPLGAAYIQSAWVYLPAACMAVAAACHTKGNLLLHLYVSWISMLNVCTKLELVYNIPATINNVKASNPPSTKLELVYIYYDMFCMFVLYLAFSSIICSTLCINVQFLIQYQAQGI